MSESEYNLNLDGSYMSEDQIFLDIIGYPRIGPDMIAIITGEVTPSNPFDKLDIYLSMNEMGRWIRNSYGLWQEDNPHVVLNPEPSTDSIIDHPLFPDNIAGRVIARLKEYYLTNRPKAASQGG